eukprot:TRINITY_DN7322_c0_g2_i5.p1 TRINITY_DN7322_c0_g2~~TRINITY_DN7322_c0_g2_i5.p1  ORF type:complete len:845 (-),score=292.80 TRINITY_DN7322_c0_g2_i5:93-2627(-)
MKSTKSIIDEFEKGIRCIPTGEDSSSDPIPTGTGKTPKKPIDDVIDILKPGHKGGTTGIDRPTKRRNSFSDKTDYEKEKDERNTGSYPCSPRTEKEKSMPPLVQVALPPNQLPDNVYSESVPPKDPRLINRRNLVDFGCQTPPFEKIEAFRKRMKAQGTRKKRPRMFDNSSSPLDMIPETPEEDNEPGGPEGHRRNRDELTGVSLLDKNGNPIADGPVVEKSAKKNVVAPVVFGVGGSKKPSSSSIIEEDKGNQSGVGNRPSSPPQVTDEGLNSIISKPLNPIDEKMLSGKGRNQVGREPSLGGRTLVAPNKVPEVFEDNDGYTYSSSNVKAGMIPLIDGVEAKKEERKEEKKKERKEAKKHTKKGDEQKEEAKGSTLKSEPINPAKENSDKHLSNTNSNVEIEKPIPINDEDIMGTFDKDPNDDCLLIRENPDGTLIDLKGRRVNKQGYLIDDNENIVNQKGEIVMSKEEFEKELEFDNDNQRPVVQNNPLFKDPAEENARHGDVKVERAEDIAPVVTPVIESKGKVKRNEKDEAKQVEENKERDMEGDKEGDNEEILEERKSVSLDSLMGDTPSNYNIPNQRYDDPLTEVHSRLSAAQPPTRPVRPVKKEKPIDESTAVAKIYGGNAKKGKRRTNYNKSANKRAFEKAFEPVQRKYSSEAKRDALQTDEAAKDGGPALGQMLNSGLRSKPLTARGSAKQVEETKRSKSRRDNDDELEKAYNSNIEDMFLPSDDDNISVGSANRSVISHASNKSNKIKGLERIYLQRLESSSKHNKKMEKKKKKGRKAKRNGNSESGSERDEISTLLMENYNAMQKQFNRNQKAENTLSYMEPEVSPTKKKLL